MLIHDYLKFLLIISQYYKANLPFLGSKWLVHICYNKAIVGGVHGRRKPISEAMSVDELFRENVDRVIPVNLDEEMRSSFIDYAMSVITDRALPDVRDGLKPVHRRILYSMYTQNFTPDKPYRKCATAVGDVIGRFHPHGDAAVYDAMVRLAQSWSMRHPLIDGHGNFGSRDGDAPAAYRYTEARLEKISLELLRDINKDTVDFKPTLMSTSWSRQFYQHVSQFTRQWANGNCCWYGNEYSTP